MTQAELEALCARWQKILRLQDWKLTVRLARRYEMSESDAWGECHWKLDLKSATILILDPRDVQSDKPYDPESVLVHELIHLHLVYFRPERDSLAERMMEQAINCLEDALISLARGGGAPDAVAARAQLPENEAGNVVDIAAWRAQRESNVQGPFIRQLA